MRIEAKIWNREKNGSEQCVTNPFWQTHSKMLFDSAAAAANRITWKRYVFVLYCSKWDTGSGRTASVPWVGLGLALIYCQEAEGAGFLILALVYRFPEALSQIPMMYSLFLVTQVVQNPRRSCSPFTSHLTGHIAICMRCPEVGAGV